MASPDDMLSADIDLTFRSRRLQARVNVPAGPTPLIQLLPVARSLTDAAVAAVTQDAAELGTPIRCEHGCAACCRHLVPVTETEARALARLVESLPEERRQVIRARFAATLQHVERAGLMEGLRRSMLPGQPMVNREYLALNLPCPFLEDESCSIHSDRPLVCREYNVISDPALCAQHSTEVKVVMIPLGVRGALAALEGASECRLPLILALEWVADHPEPPPEQPGPELLRRFFSNLTGKNLGAPPDQENPCPP